ncbi:MAG: hypothetical protein ACTSVV_06210 [Promethearchaeota archaeon]
MLDTNAIIKCLKIDKNIFLNKKDLFTTIFTTLEHPPSINEENIKVIYPQNFHYERAFRYALLLRKKGIPIPIIDLLIATITIDKNFILISDDGHFNLFQKIEPRLKIINVNDFINQILI